MSETDLTARAVYLYLATNCAKTLKSMVPLDKTAFILPNNMKIALSNCLLDVVLSRMYPAVHEIILDYVKVCNSIFFAPYRNESIAIAI